MKVMLNAWERAVLNNLLAAKSDNVMALRMVREFREQLCWTDEEMKDWGIKDNLVEWEDCPTCKTSRRMFGDPLEARCSHRLKLFTLNKPLEKYVYDLLKALDDGKRVTPREETLVEKFCYPPDDEAEKPADKE